MKSELIKQITFHPSAENHPIHLGIIPDGGRRWALKQNCKLSDSYAYTRKLLANLVRNAKKWNISEWSIYLSSAQNYRREKHELDAFSNEILHASLNELNELTNSHGIKVTIAGNYQYLSPELAANLSLLEKKSSRNHDLKLNLCIAYNPMDEISMALKNAPNHDNLTDYLWVKTPLDLIIRTGDANLLSNFLPLQSGFARIYFFSQVFNDITESDIEETLNHYLSQQLKYGT